MLLIVFEISSTGFITKENHETLGRLHKFTRIDLKKTVFKNNLNALSWYGSYQIWLSRETPEFTAPPYHIPHIGDLPASCEGTGRARALGPGLWEVISPTHCGPATNVGSCPGPGLFYSLNPLSGCYSAVTACCFCVQQFNKLNSPQKLYFIMLLKRILLGFESPSSWFINKLLPCTIL